MGTASLFEKDFKEAIQFFPKLTYRKSGKEGNWIVSGELDICDKNGDFWETFVIAIYIANSYPYCVPLVRELSHIIKRDDDWHISSDGFCCLDIDHKLLRLERRGISFFDFLKNIVYPYFANQIYKQNRDEYAAGEYQHYFDGVEQFYQDELKIESINLAIDILQAISANRLPGRNELCICGSRKYKRCHMMSVEFLRSLPAERLIKDLEGFSNLNNRSKI